MKLKIAEPDGSKPKISYDDYIKKRESFTYIPKPIYNPSQTSDNSTSGSNTKINRTNYYKKKY
jgi:hypothetical protein